MGCTMCNSKEEEEEEEEEKYPKIININNKNDWSQEPSDMMMMEDTTMTTTIHQYLLDSVVTVGLLWSGKVLATPIFRAPLQGGAYRRWEVEDYYSHCWKIEKVSITMGKLWQQFCTNKCGKVLLQHSERTSPRRCSKRARWKTTHIGRMEKSQSQWRGKLWQFSTNVHPLICVIQIYNGYTIFIKQINPTVFTPPHPASSLVAIGMAPTAKLSLWAATT